MGTPRGLGLATLFTAVMLCGCATDGASGPTGTSIDQLPMYGGLDRSSDPELKAADEKLIEDTSRRYGSRAAASSAFADQGFAYYNRDDMQNAMRRFNQAWLLNADNPDAYWGFAVVLSDQQRFCDATTHMETALGKNGLQSAALPDAAIIFTGCALTGAAAERQALLLSRSEELFILAISTGAPKDYTLLMWARAKFAQSDYVGAWAKVKEMRESTGASPPESFLRDLEEKMPEPR